jgi:hypothetical protein
MITKKDIEEIKEYWDWAGRTSRNKEYMLACFALKAIECLDAIESTPTGDSFNTINLENNWTRFAKKKARETLKELGKV